MLTLILALLPTTVGAETHVVTNTADNGPGSLRQMLTDAAPGDTITFDPAAFPAGSPRTIFLQSVLPALDRNTITIDGGAAVVVIEGRGVVANGLIVSADGCTIRRLTIRGFVSNSIILTAGSAGNIIESNEIIANGGNGIDLRGTGTDGNQIRGNFIGIERSGRFAVANTFNGVAISAGARNNVIGGTTAAHRNIISGNRQNGVWIGGTGTQNNQVIGNYIGVRGDGLGPVPNGGGETVRYAGVAIQNGAQNNRVGDARAGAGNLISGNAGDGVYISDALTSGNRVLGNLIGLNYLGQAPIGQGYHGVAINAQANANWVGDGSTLGRNIISGNPYDGVRITGAGTANNRVLGNYIGSNIAGSAALPNGLHGVEIATDAQGNIVGGLANGEGNLLSGNANHGAVITDRATGNSIIGNLIGTDATGTTSLGGQGQGGIDLANDSDNNLVEANLISGNQTDGIALFDNSGDGTDGNRIRNNRIGLTGANQPLPNNGPGILIGSGAKTTEVSDNTVAHNRGYGIWIGHCSANALRRNEVYSNTLQAIYSTCPTAPPTITAVSLGATDTITGTTLPNAVVDLFSDYVGDARIYEGSATANPAGQFSFSPPGGRFSGPNVTASATPPGADSSALSAPAHLLWTILLYLNGDNDLEDALADTMTHLAAGQASPRANVLALFDGGPGSASGTRVYDLTRGARTQLSAPFAASGELNMGSGQTLIDFVTWAREAYPARNLALSIVDHGGGWGPSGTEVIPGALPRPGRQSWLAGGSGLSWDFTSDYDYLESPEIRSALATITDNGSDRIDVLIYDVCLMGMIEVAYQVEGYTDYFISAQNIGWAPEGPEHRYVRLLRDLPPDADGASFSRLFVDAYAASLPPEGHPFTVAAVDMRQLPALVTSTITLANQLIPLLTNEASAADLRAVYTATQKIDYDSNFVIEPERDGFVDLYDLALKISQGPFAPSVKQAASGVIAAHTQAVIAERHNSGAPYPTPERIWPLDNVHGLSIFLPLGEDLELPIVVTPTVGLAAEPSRNLRLRDLYATHQLRFVQETTWPQLIDRYYVAVTQVVTGTTSGPVDGLQIPDVTPPTTVITLTTQPVDIPGTLRLNWSATEPIANSSGVAGAELWLRTGITWTRALTQTAASGQFSRQLTRCVHQVAVRGRDKAGNLEPITVRNSARITIQSCRQFLPLVSRVERPPDDSR